MSFWQQENREKPVSFWQQENREISKCHFGSKKTGRLASVILAARKQGDKLVSFWQQEHREKPLTFWQQENREKPVSFWQQENREIS